MTKKTPGPLASPVRSRPSLKMTALSYSCTTFTTKMREKGRVVVSKMTEHTVRMWENICGPSSQPVTRHSHPGT